jgi:diguanylate cyclase (GGDEF)-like protein
MALSMSLRLRLAAPAVALLIVLVGLAVFTVSSLVVIDRRMEESTTKWLSSAQIVGELADRISEFRIAETYRALATNPRSRKDAELLAEGHRRIIEELQAEYARDVGTESTADLHAFQTAWTAYLAGHEAWIKEDVDGLIDEPAHPGSHLDALYHSVDGASDRLMMTKVTFAHAHSESIDRTIDRTITLIMGFCGIAALIGLWLAMQLRENITRPLGTITKALTRIAVGDWDVRVPELNRTDEIGLMANALEVFRLNVQQLEQSRAETRAAQQQAELMARHDPLTGLPNRRVFLAEMHEALARTQSSPVTYVVLRIDLDRFKSFNDRHGHAVGDIVLCEVARRLGEITRKEDLVARLGSDEFVIVAEIDRTSHGESLTSLAHVALHALQQPIHLGTDTLEIGASIGIALCPVDGSDPESILRAAGIATQRAKQDGRHTYRFFEKKMDEDLQDQMKLENDLKQAIRDGQIEPNYEPLVDIQNHHIYGFEILARWNHPQRGKIPPDVFIPLVEQLGMMPELTHSVLQRACRDARQWPAYLSLSLNISPSQLKDPLLPSQILPILVQEGFSPHRLEIEITETALVSDIQTAKTILASFQSFGIKILMDDFGTGYSSLHHLHELKFDKVKIDRSFVQSMLLNPESEKIVAAILSLAKGLGLATVAEGVEDAGTFERLAQMGCEFAQGFYFGRAIASEGIAEVIAADNVPPDVRVFL